jgi:hypothetical protein
MVLIKFRLVMVILIVLVAIGVGIVSADTRIFPASMEHGPFTEFRLTTDEAVPNAQYGRSVAIDGDLVAVGMGGDGAIGAVYLYKRQGMRYVPEAELVFPDAIPITCPEKEVGNCPEFGRSVAIQGNTVIVGARFAPVGSLKAGAAYVFMKHGDSWHYEDKIVSPAPEAEDNFGRALAIQGNLLIVTARKTIDEEGAAYVFVNRHGTWIHQANLEANDPTKGAYFGQSVDIQGDVIAIGARNANPNGAGGFYLFRKSRDGWVEIAKVTPSDGQFDDQYGFTIAISGDVITVGARRADHTGAKNAGAAYVYSLKRDSVKLVTKLTASDSSAGDEFGQSIAIVGDVIAVGAWRDDITEKDDNKGSIYLFHRKGGQWIETNKITASDGMAGDEFGYSLSAFGNRIVTGAHTADFISKDGGAAYVLPLKP